MTKGKKPYKSWIKDGVQGGPSSMEVLIDWLSHKPNYIKWKQDYSLNRVPKKELIEEIIDKLRQAGIYHRLAKDIASKISTILNNYRTIRKWREINLNNGNSKTIQQEVLKRFPYWNLLNPVFEDFDTRVSQFIFKCQKNECLRMEEIKKMLYYYTQKRVEKVKNQKNLIYKEKLQAKLYFEQCLYGAGFTETESVYIYDSICTFKYI